MEYRAIVLFGERRQSARGPNFGIGRLFDSRHIRTVDFQQRFVGKRSILFAQVIGIDRHSPSTIVVMDHHTIALISIVGICLDVLGGLYLAYDLLGGRHGPLRLLTRAITYSIVFGTGYGLGLGLIFGVASGLATGITVAIELNRSGSERGHYSLPWEALFSAIRGAAVAAGLYWRTGLQFAIAFAVLIT
ncbi:MAG: hypothetical protein QOG67_1533, partial [Verrucomicrobiota bacterium]